MKRVLTLFIAFLLVASIIGLNTDFDVKAISNGYYDFYCSVSEYEVSYITDDGKFEMESCHSSFDQAKREMERLGSDYVVRHAKSQSPTMIIAMVSGNAYTYPARSGKVTMNIYEDLEDRSASYKKTYVANHYEMHYEGTEMYFTNRGEGMIKCTLNGFDGYTDLEYVDLVPDKFLDKGLSIILGGGDTTGANEQPFSVTCRRNYYTVRNDELVFVFHRSYSKSGGYDEEHSIILGPAPSGFYEGERYYSSNGYQFYYDPQETEYFTTYYPYYQYLPVRSTSDITADDFDEAFYDVSGRDPSLSVMDGIGEYFVEAQNEYGINALILYAMAAHESAWGTSSYAVERNNLFGWAAYDSDPNNASSFASLEKAIDEHAGYNLRKYTDIYSSLFFGSHVGNKGSGFNVQYASDPYWGMDIAAIAYQIDKANGLVDYNEYNFAVVSEFNAAFYNEDGDTYFTAQYGPDYQECLTVIVLASDSDRTLVQSPNPIDDGVIYVTMNGSGNGDGPTNKVEGLVPYDFKESVVYIDTDALSFVMDGDYDIPEIPDDPSDTPDDTPDISGMDISFIDSVGFSGYDIHLEGVAFTIGRNYYDDTTHEILIVDSDTDEVVERFDAKTIKNPANYNDGKVYDYIGYTVDFDVKDLDLSYGDYYFMISVDGLEPFELTDSSFAIEGSYNYILSVDQNYNNRLSLEVLAGKDSGIYLSTLDRPSQRSSINSNYFSINNNTLTIDGYGWIFYVDFLSSSNTSYQLYLVNEDDGTTYKMKMSDGTVDEGVLDFNEKTYSNTYEDIFYHATYDLSGLKSGRYKAYLYIVNGQYKDYIKATNFTASEDSAGRYEIYTENDQIIVSVD